MLEIKDKNYAVYVNVNITSCLTKDLLYCKSLG